MNTPKYLIVHHEAPPVVIPDTAKRFDIVDQYHKSKGWGGIGYHAFIERDGELKQGRADNEEGAHTIGKNQESLGICMAGNMDLQDPTTAQVETLTKWLKEKMAQYNIPIENVVPHRRFANKSCYGLRLKDDWAQNLVKKAISTEELTPYEIERIRKIMALFRWLK